MTTAYIIATLVTIVIGLIGMNYRDAIVKLDKAHVRIDEVKKSIEEALKAMKECKGDLITVENCRKMRQEELEDFASHFHEEGKVIIRREVRADG